MKLLEKSERRGGGRCPKISESMKDDIIQMYREGFKIIAIQKKHSISRSSVYNTLKEREK